MDEGRRWREAISCVEKSSLIQSRVPHVSKLKEKKVSKSSPDAEDSIAHTRLICLALEIDHSHAFWPKLELGFQPRLLLAEKGQRERVCLGSNMA